MEEKLIWQPIALYQPSYNFGIILNRDFVEEMVSSYVSTERQEKMNELGSEMIKKMGHKDAPNPYGFDNENAFVRQFSLGENGVWLVVDHCYGESPLEVYEPPEQIPFSSHNVRNSSQAYALMSLVDMWVEYAKFLKEK